MKYDFLLPEQFIHKTTACCLNSSDTALSSFGKLFDGRQKRLHFPSTSHILTLLNVHIQPLHSAYRTADSDREA